MGDVGYRHPGSCLDHSLSRSCNQGGLWDIHCQKRGWTRMRMRHAAWRNCVMRHLGNCFLVRVWRHEWALVLLQSSKMVHLPPPSSQLFELYPPFVHMSFPARHPADQVIGSIYPLSLDVPSQYRYLSLQHVASVSWPRNSTAFINYHCKCRLCTHLPWPCHSFLMWHSLDNCICIDLNSKPAVHGLEVVVATDAGQGWIQEWLVSNFLAGSLVAPYRLSVILRMLGSTPSGTLTRMFRWFFFVCPAETRMNHETVAGICYLLDTISYSSDVVKCTYISVDCNFSLLLNVKAWMHSPVFGFPRRTTDESLRGNVSRITLY